MSNNLFYNQFIYCIYKDSEVQNLSSEFIGNPSAKIDHYLFCFRKANSDFDRFICIYSAFHIAINLRHVFHCLGIFLALRFFVYNFMCLICSLRLDSTSGLVYLLDTYKSLKPYVTSYSRFLT